MRYFTIYLISVGLAFYGGMKISKKPMIKTIIEKVTSYDRECDKALLDTIAELNSCVRQYDNLVEAANREVKNLEVDVDSCNDRYYEHTPHENLKPDKVKAQEPKMGGIYEDY